MKLVVFFFILWNILQNNFKYIFALFKDNMKILGNLVQDTLVTFHCCGEVYSDALLNWCREFGYTKGSRHQYKFKMIMLIRFTHWIPPLYKVYAV